MARIAFHPLGHWGHILPTFELARALVARGHAVHYFALAGFERAVTSRGFQYVPILAHRYPQGTLASTSNDPLVHGQRRPMDQRMGVIQATGEGEIDDALVRHRPDLLLVDAFATVAALRAHRLGIPLAFVNPSLPLYREADLPPSTGLLGPPRTLAERVRVEWEWAKLRWQRTVRERNGLSAFMFNAAHRFAAPWQRHMIETSSALGPWLTGIPEVVLCPAELDFPRPARKDRHFVDAQVELERADAPAFDWDKIAGWDHLVYASQGSMNYAYPDDPRHFQAVIDGVLRRPERTLVLSIGDFPNPSALRFDERRVLLVRWVPQVELLRRTRIAITHGGLGTIKECVTLGVPMVVVPQVFEQPGNAARVAHHGLGVVGDPAQVSADSVDRWLRTIEDDPAYQRKVDGLREVFAQAAREQRGAEVVERLLAR